MSGPATIEDGRSGNTAKVDSENRLAVASVSKTAAINASLEGDTFFITTGSVNLTDDSESWLLYVKNNDTVPWVVASLAATYGASDGVGDAMNQFNVGATDGTLLTEGIDLPGINLNIGSPKQLASTIKLGGQGKTLTGGTDTPPTLVPEGMIIREFQAAPVVIPQGSSFAAAYTPPTGNTSQNTTIQIVIFRETVE